ncbi:PTS system N-acetylgalactosamine-specific IIA component [Breznakia sp. PF5-3]|uniref:PTS sugar transporter subunit IIA n=1 Tax=unclassified Breznakia TaxID=2623764 RepID=UPI0024074642|nr:MULTISPECIES: PTS fructose transporter subunit IIA [unclassified Breznakia]MDF9823815.1 PTS system N-acetylgalactosamine-specific IIA component [Breznakia sp. PM6-1]MDF9834619.1 PTS system N-acetylgalactosamine-specific IIA component [Breznakia sp. PF5-3]MDF9836764.1 PTS system N-acetylgalactosamine-specific IIA component [Breznakia sp. PFB2-8]MDF9858787.1 PTS system N-acetylgalactosamine-specific IIA component [Breznakia sp. PH5-24]
MKYVVMVSHGEFAPGLHTAVNMMTGEREDVLSTSLKDGMGTPEFIENFKALIEPIKAEDEIILLADILSGSPFTSALGVLDEKGMMEKTTVFAGMNMPLAVSAVLMKDNMDGDILKESLLSEGKTGLCIFEAPVEDSDDDI